jgi:hypothetical protein
MKLSVLLGVALVCASVSLGQTSAPSPLPPPVTTGGNAQAVWMPLLYFAGAALLCWLAYRIVYFGVLHALRADREKPKQP